MVSLKVFLKILSELRISEDLSRRKPRLKEKRSIVESSLHRRRAVAAAIP